MMPIAGTPILVHLMRLYASQGHTEFILAAGHRKEILVDYFSGRYGAWDVRIIDTGEESDTGDRIKTCAPYLNSTFLATYGDGLGNINLSELLAFHRQQAGLAAVTSVPLRSQYGTVVFDASQRVKSFVEKPVIPDCWINAGFFVFDSKVFAHWEGHNLEVQVLPKLAEKGTLYAYRHRGFWKSMDTSKDQSELERIYYAGTPPWEDFGAEVSAANAYQVVNGKSIGAEA
jgi:glucose-1-phosphate cytidylyltransferase